MKTCKKLSFSDKIRCRIRALWCIMLLMIAYMVFIVEIGGGNSRIMTDLAHFISRVLFFGGLIYIGFSIRRNKKLLENKLLLKEKLLSEQDELNQYLYDKSGGLALDLTLLCMLIATWTASLFNMPAFYTAFSLLCAVLFIKGGLYLWHSRFAA